MARAMQSWNASLDDMSEELECESLELRPGAHPIPYLLTSGLASRQGFLSLVLGCPITAPVSLLGVK